MQTSETPAPEARAFQTIRVQVEGPLGRLTLARPDRLNAMNALMLQELAQAAHWFDEHRQLRVVIVSGEGRAFTAGADMNEPPVLPALPGSGNPWIYRREAGQYGFRMAEAIEQMRAVTIAQVHGHAVGGGVVLMAACDLRVVAEDTVMFIPEVDIGIPLAWGAIPRLVREIGPALTKELVMTCRRFSAAEAKAIGFVNRVAPAGEVVAVAEALAAELVAKPPVPVAITKEHVTAITRAMSVATTSFADGDGLLGVVTDPESLGAMREYVASRLGKDRTRS
ncbi:MAG: enoyl-CoA hydratase/isomerase family protein [Deltaproteobacteria bacterium]|nr:enoyl-CoA hydratase/isomerase family protein [Deltaproteobacteria bacterium]